MTRPRSTDGPGDVVGTPAWLIGPRYEAVLRRALLGDGEQCRYLSRLDRDKKFVPADADATGHP